VIAKCLRENFFFVIGEFAAMVAEDPNKKLS
jgi:hypothetical protein